MNDLLRKESANVKEAFQKSEELNKMLKKEQEKAQRDKAALKSEMGGLKEVTARFTCPVACIALGQHWYARIHTKFV